MSVGLRASDVPNTSAAAQFYANARDGKTSSLEAAMQNLRMSEGLAQNWGNGPASPDNAARHEDSARTVVELLEYKAPKTGLTPLMVAIQNGHMLVAQQLLEYGADVNATSAKGRTALQRCVKGNGVMFPMDLQMVTMLLEHGANPFCADHKGWTTLGYALQRRASMGQYVPNNFELVLRSLLQRATFSGPLEIKLNKLLGLAKGWKRLFSALVPFYPDVHSPATEVQLLMIDEQTLSLVDWVWVTRARGETCPTRARLHVDLVVRAQPKLAEVYVKETEDREFKLQLRALDDSLMESNRLNKLVTLACLEPEAAAEHARRRTAEAGLPRSSTASPSAAAGLQGSDRQRPSTRNLSNVSLQPFGAMQSGSARALFEAVPEGPSSVPSVPASLSGREVPATLAASREALRGNGVTDATIDEEPPRSSRGLQPLIQRSDSAHMSI